ncbi:MAG: FMN-binding protein [Ruminococcus sp.]|nr:FMN-binding protein [Ruminococcus sp.]
MLFLIALFLAFGFAILFDKPLKKYPYVFYVVAVILTVSSIILAGTDTHSLPEFVNNYIIGLFTRGAFATALWYVVMFTGALPNGSESIKKLMPIRSELSIFTAILTLGHNIGFGQTYFVRFFTDSARMSGNQKIASILSISMLVIMIPLTVMSFPVIRKKMNPKLWKKLQRTAYIFYAMIYIHVLVLYYPMSKAGRDGIFFNILVYSVAFIGYAVMRIRKYIVIRKKPQNKIILNIASAVIFLSAVTGVLISCRKDIPEKISDSEIIHSIVTTITTTAVSSESTSLITSSADAITTVTTSSTITTALQTDSATDNTTTDTTETTVIDETSGTSETTSATETTETVETIVTTTETPETEENTENNIYNEVNTEVSESETEHIPVWEEDTQPEETHEESQAQHSEPETEPVYIYRNGTYSASAYGYDGDVYADVTIENDVIISISAHTEESDDWYFCSAQDSVISQIISAQNTNVDAVSGATYSSKAIMEAVRKALESAKN